MQLLKVSCRLKNKQTNKQKTKPQQNNSLTFLTENQLNFSIVLL